MGLIDIEKLKNQVYDGNKSGLKSTKSEQSEKKAGSSRWGVGVGKTAESQAC